MRGKDLLYDLSFIDDDIVQEAAAEETPECFKKGEKSGNDGAGSAVAKKRSRQRLIAAAACLMLAVGVTAAVSQTDLFGILDRGTSETVGNDAEHAQVGTDNESSSAADQDNLTADAAASGENGADDKIVDAAGEADKGSALKKEATPSGGASYGSSGASESYKENNGSASSSRADSGSSDQMVGSGVQSGAAEGSKYDAPVMSPMPDLSESAPGSDAGASPGNGDDTLGDTATSAPSSGASSGGGGSSASAAQIISSPELASYLRALDYTGGISAGSAEYTVVDQTDGSAYYVNLTEGFARSAVGQVKLTEAQKAHIKQLLQQAQ